MLNKFLQCIRITRLESSADGHSRAFGHLKFSRNGHPPQEAPVRRLGGFEVRLQLFLFAASAVALLLLRTPNLIYV